MSVQASQKIYCYDANNSLHTYFGEAVVFRVKNAKRIFLHSDKLTRRLSKMVSKKLWIVYIFGVITHINNSREAVTIFRSTHWVSSQFLFLFVDCLTLHWGKERNFLPLFFFWIGDFKGSHFIFQICKCLWDLHAKFRPTLSVFFRESSHSLSKITFFENFIPVQNLAIH